LTVSILFNRSQSNREETIPVEVDGRLTGDRQQLSQ